MAESLRLNDLAEAHRLLLEKCDRLLAVADAAHDALRLADVPAADAAFADANLRLVTALRDAGYVLGDVEGKQGESSAVATGDAGVRSVAPGPSASSESSHAEPWRIKRASRAATNTAEPGLGPEVERGD